MLNSTISWMVTMSNLILSSKEAQNLTTALLPIHFIIDSVSNAGTEYRLKQMIALIHRKISSAADSEKFVKDLDFYIGYEYCEDWKTAMEMEQYDDGYKWEIPTVNDLIEISKCIDNPFTEEKQYWSNEVYSKTKATTYDFYNEELNTRPKKESNYCFYISRKGEPNV